MFEKVLVCLDRSPESEAILPYIYKEARHFKKVIFLSVLPTPAINLPFGVPGEAGGPVQTKKMLEEFQQAMTDTPVYLEAKAQPLRDMKIPVKTVVQEGIPSRSIVEYIQANNVALLAIATHGHSGFREIALGGTAEYLLRHAGIPVMLVTPKKKGKVKNPKL